MFEIPLPLPIIVLEDTPDETGFLMKEKRTLRNAWNQICSKAREHANEQSLRFLTENEEMLEKFRNKKGELDIRFIYEHPIRMFDLLKSMIYDGLESNSNKHGIIKPVAAGHQKQKIVQDDIKRMTNHLAKYLKEVLQKGMSPTLEKTIDKLCDIIGMGHQ